MSKLKATREQKNLTQEELSEKSKISVRTIQRIEAGTEPKGHTLRALAQALEIEEISLQETFVIPETKPSDEITYEIIPKVKEEQESQPEINYSLIKIINLSSLLFTLLPTLNIFIPLLLMFTLKQRNSMARQIITLQILWRIMAPIVFMLGIFLKLGRQFTMPFIIAIILVNVFMVLRNAAEIDRNKKLYFRLNFNMI
ncbi:DNA-binding protein [Chryseobacterium pennae]|uniref:DNA-binding protein n=1 Tax=Chryseobacterium pennae TaxID=2258962 RepID=A0A3D9C882_9FLAO|nr:helix-turn-helix transcriptional regulator [Chryseobacterium pennae]REC61949.1 DNA-binding protein [Chryseobacterium pennae]